MSTVHQPAAQAEASNPQELRVTTKTPISKYVPYVWNLLVKDKTHDSVTISAAGKAINKAVAIAEISKRRIGDLHQTTKLFSQEMEFKPRANQKEESKHDVGASNAAEDDGGSQTKRSVSIIEITLSKSALDSTCVGYQPPEPRDENQRRYRSSNYGRGRQSSNFRGRGGSQMRGRFNSQGNFRGGRYNNWGGYNNRVNYGYNPNYNRPQSNYRQQSRFNNRQ
jgi:ribonuclease P/MRP protein subunit RPP25